MAEVRHSPGGVTERAKEPEWKPRSVGTDPAEAKLYRALVGLGGTGVDDLAHRCQLSSATVGAASRGAGAAGLVAQSAAVPGRWVAAPPGIALRALVNDRRHELEQAELVAARLAEVHRTDAAGNVHDLVEVVVGASAVGQRFHQLQLGAVEEVCVLVTDQPDGGARDGEPGRGHRAAAAFGIASCSSATCSSRPRSPSSWR